MWEIGFNCFYFPKLTHHTMYLELAGAWVASLYFGAVFVSGTFRFSFRFSDKHTNI